MATDIKEREWDAAAAAERILRDGSPVIERAAHEFNLDGAELAGVFRAAVIRSSPACLTAADLSVGQPFSEAQRAHAEKCELCSAVVAAMEEPAVPKRVEEFLSEVRHGGELANQTLLVVEDDTPMRTLVTKILQDAGATVEAVGTMAEAEAKAAEIHLDGVVADIFLGRPHDESNTAYVLLPKLEAIVRQPFYKISISAHRDEKARSEKEGFDAFLEKPLSADDLVSTASELYANSRRLVNAS